MPSGGILLPTLLIAYGTFTRFPGETLSCRHKFLCQCLWSSRSNHACPSLSCIALACISGTLLPANPCHAGGAPWPGFREGAKQTGKGQSDAPRQPGRLCCFLCGRALAGTNAWGARWLHRELQFAMSKRIWQGILKSHLDDNDPIGEVTAAAMLC